VIIPGVNRFGTTETQEVAVHRVPMALERAQVERVRRVRATRDEAAVAGALERLGIAARGTENLMPRVVAAVSAYATVGEITGALRRVFGTYVPPEF
jgi:methylmalonyl-CoA mutase N-terminal domain/subunit